MFTLDAPDNLIVEQSGFTNWATDGTSSKSVNGITLSKGNGNATYTFQEGFNGYAKTVDTFVDSSTPTQQNENAVSLVLDNDTLTRDRVVLMRFENITGTLPGQIPPGSIVESGTLTLYVNTEGQEIGLHRMTGTWAEHWNWNSFSPALTNLQGVPNAAHAKTTADINRRTKDDGTALDTYVGGITLRSTESGTAVAMRDTIQAWVNGTANYGWLVTSHAEADGLQIDSSEGATATRRPLLTVKLAGTSDNYAYVSVYGSIATSTEYWMKAVVDNESAGMTGNVQITALGVVGNEISSVAGTALDVGTPGQTGTYYARVKTAGTQQSSGTSRLVLAHANSPAGETLRLSNVTLYPIPDRSSAKIALLGDRESGYASGVANAVDTAILSTRADTINVVSPGDMSDGTPSYATSLDSLKNALASLNGTIYPAAGNWDYSGGIANWETYFAQALNGLTGQSNRYYRKVLGECEFFFYDSNSANTDNNQVDVAGAKADVMGAWLLNAISTSTAKWKIPVIHHPMYSSSTHHGGPSTEVGWSAAFKSMQWDWLALGCPLVINSHEHVAERMHVGGTMHWCFALGGGSANAFGTPIAESKFRALTSGFLKFYDSPTAFVVEYYDTSVPPVLLDRVKITRTP